MFVALENQFKTFSMTKTILKFSLPFFILVTIISCNQLGKKQQDDIALKNRIDAYLTKAEANGLSGAVLVAKKETLIINKGYGLANKEQGITNTTKTIFDVGSVTKQFTAAAILKLVELNKLKVTDSLKTFFNDLPADKKNITIHQLLTHSAGLTDIIGNGDFDHISTDIYFKELFKSELINTPGSKFEYSNSGYSVLGRIIELVSAQDYESFLQTTLFNPSGMFQTGYLKPEWDSNLYAIGYQENVINMGSMAARYRKEGKVSWSLKGNGGINSTLEDMYKWYLALKTNKVLSKELTELLTSPYMPESEDATSYYAYGWTIFNTDRNTKRITHNGGNGIFFHDFIWLPKEDVTIIYFSNAFTQQIMDVAWYIEDMLFDGSFEPRPIVEDLSTSVLKYTLAYEGNLDDLPLKMKNRFDNKIEHSFYLNDLGYYFVKEGLLDKAVAIFKLNVILFPKESNLWDSLGESYDITGNKQKAIEAYRKALELEPNYGNAEYAKKIIGV